MQVKSRYFFTVTLLSILICIAGCFHHEPTPIPKQPNISPATQSTTAPSLPMDKAEIVPMFQQMFAVDLPTVVKVAEAQNIDIQEARQRTLANAGKYESSVENIFPVIAPSLLFEHLRGGNRAVQGPVTFASFNSFLPAVAIQWALNPGRVYYDIVASKKRLLASEQQEKFTIRETTRIAAYQYYELVLAQVKLSVAKQAVSEAEELLRIAQQRVKTGTGLPVDEYRAKSALAGRNQDMIRASNDFYISSLNLSFTLHLDAVVTLVPAADHTDQITLIRDNLSIEEMLVLAAQWRDDLHTVRTLVEAATADRGIALWGGIGPQFQASYQYGGLTTQVHGKNYPLSEQQRAAVGAAWQLGLSTFGQMKTADANQQQAILDAQRQLDLVRLQVVRYAQESSTNAKLIPAARQQVDSATEALRLTQANLHAGTMLALDVLQSQDDLDQARVRYAEALIRYNQSQINLLAAMGLINSESLGIEKK